MDLKSTALTTRPSWCSRAGSRLWCVVLYACAQPTKNTRFLISAVPLTLNDNEKICVPTFHPRFLPLFANEILKLMLSPAADPPPLPYSSAPFERPRLTFRSVTKNSSRLTWSFIPLFPKWFRILLQCCLTVLHNFGHYSRHFGVTGS